MTLKIGCDPELFVFRNGKPTSGHVFQCGTKEAPQKTPHGFVQVDGTALEFNIAPAQSRLAFITSVKATLGDLERIVQGHGPEYSLGVRSVVKYTKKYLASLPEKARELGCNPDFDAYEMVENAPPDADLPIRTASGHVHLGWGRNFDPTSYDHAVECARVVKQLDFFLGLPSLIWEPDPTRRVLYGKAGAFRPKTYGVEYRVLSNVWLKSDDLIGEVYDRTTQAYDCLVNGLELHLAYGDFARDAINRNVTDWPRHNRELAKHLGVV